MKENKVEIIIDAMGKDCDNPERNDFITIESKKRR